MYREQGYLCWITEHWNAFARKRQDLLGFADVLAIGNGRIVLCQTTTASNRSARRRKIYDLDSAGVWLSNGGHIELVSWEDARGVVEAINLGDWTNNHDVSRIPDFLPARRVRRVLPVRVPVRKEPVPVVAATAVLSVPVPPAVGGVLHDNDSRAISPGEKQETEHGQET